MRLAASLAAAILMVPAVAGSNAPNLGVAYICSAEKTAEPTGPEKLVVLPGMGSGGFTIRTSNPEAQLWFDYGLKLYHGFYHREAQQAFDKAAALDPDCAMCAWGQALGSGSTMNFNATPENMAKAKAAAVRASKLGGSTAREQGLIAAMAARQAPDKGDDEHAYAKAMQDLAARLPEDDEVADLAAHALLILARGDDHDAAERAIGILQPALKRRPDDTAAIHYYIHATEFVGRAADALPYAERLAALAPDASHLVHMAAHTLMHVGRYEDVALKNAAAIATDARFDGTMGYRRVRGEAQYYAHNYAFGLAGAMMAGDRELALKYVDHASAAFAGASFNANRRAYALSRTYPALGWYDPDRALALTESPSDLPLLKIMRRYARGEAFAAKRDLGGLEAERAALKTVSIPDDQFGARDMAEVAGLVLEGRLLMLQNRPGQAADAFAKAAKVQEDKFAEDFDPPPWWYPIRRSQAAALLKAGRYKEAADQAQESLKGWPDDALALRVLAEAQRALGDKAGADRRLSQARNAWRGDLAATPLERI